MTKKLFAALSIILVFSMLIGYGCLLANGDQSGKTQQITGTANSKIGSITKTEKTSSALTHITETASVLTSVTEDTKFHSAVFTISPEEFEAKGFNLGDSCDITFENGFTLEDVPFYNGYYVKNGMPVIVAYPGFGTVAVTLNNVGIWSAAGLSEGDTATVTLHESGKYYAIQDSLGQIYSFDREKYTSDAEFCNFRALTGGNLKSDFFYRGASPVDNSRGRAPYTDTLIQAAGIRYIVDLADSEDNMTGYMAAEGFNSPYAEELYKAGRISLLNMGSAYMSDDYQTKLVSGLRAMMDSDGPVYIHCMEGKDRTGFVCMLLEALAGAGYDEMQADYMMTYANYYGVTEDGTPEKYTAIKELYFDSFIEDLLGENVEELVQDDYTGYAAAYLRNGGMTDEEITNLIAFICE